MSVINVILKQNVKNLGEKNQVIKVKEGYARNFLFANDLAIPYTASVAKKVSHERADRGAKIQRHIDDAKAKKVILEEKTIVLKVKSKDGKVFGSVNHQDISTAIKTHTGLDIDKKKVLSDHIKQIGKHTAKVKLYHDVEASINLEVI